jgi:hypothetical protein
LGAAERNRTEAAEEASKRRGGSLWTVQGAAKRLAGALPVAVCCRTAPSSGLGTLEVPRWVPTRDELPGAQRPEAGRR